LRVEIRTLELIIQFLLALPNTRYLAETAQQTVGPLPATRASGYNQQERDQYQDLSMYHWANRWVVPRKKKTPNSSNGSIY